MITTTFSLHHWNYYLAIENDLEKASRYIEFNEDNLETYSIELAHILLSSSSEIDVILKQICEIATGNIAKNINQYRDIIKEKIPNFINEKVYADRYGLNFTPWLNWNEDDINPIFWKSYNNVKHNRNNFFYEANLKNALNSVGALLISVIYLYNLKFNKEKIFGLETEITLNKTTELLKPKSSLLKLSPEYYQHPIYLYNR